ncbi:uncharacterized protein CYBJADRAFT_175946 [Cyberlindnera jadinii NRRL Y-1542]|uniref:Uncharacterized protein n=1 Tax=Cyberlindnera jadinii (strain ATCC 18201 / CBS 1600 / BCRC 20928 / JCM 3617 / NBRC 0987 / NRRL Y-1542) TaxID=983966 RepID=A0A1E4RTQ0_CYBJN|nr:hypothetical protein CYBJADRAFT_175946 [Cyberlindnera jadinii NRRL Y-1542]ODV70581.1 hypothetical protein CYBJADRAFT_175946 [Cyberlindnera jadinii NRRL Y-1542]
MTSKYSRTVCTGDSRGRAYSMTINGCLFHRVEGMIAQENGQEKFAEIYTLDSDFATNPHIESLRGVLQNDEEQNKLEDYIRKIGEFLSQHNCYAQLYSARELVQQETPEMRVTRGEIIVEFANIELTAPTSREHQIARG